MASPPPIHKVTMPYDSLRKALRLSLAWLSPIKLPTCKYSKYYEQVCYFVKREIGTGSMRLWRQETDPPESPWLGFSAECRRLWQHDSHFATPAISSSTLERNKFRIGEVFSLL
jgi:hypothetical protein